MPTIRLPGPGAASPRGAVRYARANRIPAAILLFLLAVAIASLRQKHAPDQRQAAGLAVAAVIVVLAAEVVPDVVVAFLAALVIVQAIESADLVTAALGRVLRLLPAGVGASVPRHFLPES
jgi:chromate transport protein ChrA